MEENLFLSALMEAPPQNVLRLNREVRELCSEGNDVKIERVAPLLGMGHQGLRELIGRGKCPFALGIESKKDSKGRILENAYTRVPVLPFYNFMMQTAMLGYIADLSQMVRASQSEGATGNVEAV